MTSIVKIKWWKLKNSNLEQGDGEWYVSKSASKIKKYLKNSNLAKFSCITKIPVLKWNTDSC